MHFPGEKGGGYVHRHQSENPEFFTHGFLPAQDLSQRGIRVTTSFDDRKVGGVALNCISTISGIPVSLFQKAKGGCAVAVEERLDQDGLLKEASERCAHDINKACEECRKKYEQQMTNALGGMGNFAWMGNILKMDDIFKTMAMNQVLSQDPDFRLKIEEKLHHTALFVLRNMLVKGDDTSSSDGCTEVCRPLYWR